MKRKALDFLFCAFASALNLVISLFVGHSELIIGIHNVQLEIRSPFWFIASILTCSACLLLEFKKNNQMKNILFNILFCVFAAVMGVVISLIVGGATMITEIPNPQIEIKNPRWFITSLIIIFSILLREFKNSKK